MDRSSAHLESRLRAHLLCAAQSRTPVTLTDLMEEFPELPSDLVRAAWLDVFGAEASSSTREGDASSDVWTRGSTGSGSISLCWHSDTRPLEASPGRLPESIGPYAVQSRLGTGGMGEVFVAVDSALNRRIALKRMRPDRRAAEESQKRFEIEARVTARLQHPSIIPIYHFEKTEEDLFYTMRPVEGMTLRGLLAQLRENVGQMREEWPLGRTVRLFLQAANAVAYAHSRGVIHRDLKPANIIVGPFEEVLVLDWGLAKLRRDSAILTAQGLLEVPHAELSIDTEPNAFVGTPTYMAPELFAGAQADERTDIFALGVILYEILALKHPWRREGMPSLVDAMRTAPEFPPLVQPGRNIPTELAESCQRALSHAPEQRFATVADFAQRVSLSLEGRAPWRRRDESDGKGAWRLGDGRQRREDDVLTLRSRGAGGLFRYFCLHRFTNNVRIEFEVLLRRGLNQLSVWMNTKLSKRGAIEDGYGIEVVPGRRRTLSLLRSGREVAGAESPHYEKRQWYRVRVQRDADRLGLFIDGVEVSTYSDVIPLAGGFVGITGRSDGIQLRNLEIWTRGTDVTVSCLSVPDAFFHRGFFEEARSEYEAVVASHPGRVEGELARFRSGICMLEMYRREHDRDIRAILLDEAFEAFTDGGKIEGTCLGDLGRAMVAGERGEAAQKHEALARALAGHPEDPHLPTVIEWLLGRLHGVEPDDRRTVAELLPLALDHCMAHWGSGVISELARVVRAQWETPPFMSSRGRFKEADIVGRAEAKLLCAFWAGRARLVSRTVLALLESNALKRRHLADGVFCLLALDRTSAARDLLRSAQKHSSVRTDRQSKRTCLLAEIAIAAQTGDLDTASALIGSIELNPKDRTANSARLWLAKAYFRRHEEANVLRILRHQDPRDYFAREHLAWYFLFQGNAKMAQGEMKPLLERKDHLSGRNLVNFLAGALLISQGRAEEALDVFQRLPDIAWPKTWTLGSYFAAGRLGAGSITRYTDGAFAWERRNLAEHQELLASVGFRTPERSSGSST